MAAKGQNFDFHLGLIPNQWFSNYTPDKASKEAAGYLRNVSIKGTEFLLETEMKKSILQCTVRELLTHWRPPTHPSLCCQGKEFLWGEGQASE